MNKTRQALIQSIRESDLSFGDRTKLRLILLFHGPEVEKIANEGLAEANLSLPQPQPSGSFGGQDWMAILKYFVEVILPILLKLFA